MKELVTYILGVVACSALFVTFYRTVLHRRISFRTARIYLVASLVCAAIIPALDIPVWPTAPIEVAPAATAVAPIEVAGAQEVLADTTALTPAATETVAVSEFDWTSGAIWTLWGVGLVLLTVAMVRQMVCIARIKRRAEMFPLAGCKIALSEEVSSPFSFLGTVFVGRGTSDEEMRQIVMHETSHIRHRHSHEKIAVEVMKNILWFNPFGWWAASLLAEVHEFEADRDVLDGGFTVEEYLPLIFRQIFGYNPELSVGLGDSLTKKRFLMMKNKMKLNRYSRLRVAGVLPLAAGMTMLFSFTSRQPEIIAPSAPEITEPVIATITSVPLEDIKTAGTISRIVASDASVVERPIPETAGTIAVVESTIEQEQEPEQAPIYMAEVMPSFKGEGILAFRQWVMERIVYPRDAMENNIQGKVTVRFAIETDGSVCDIEAIASPHQLLTDAAISTIERSPAWSPGMQEGKPVRVHFILPIDFSLAAPKPQEVIEPAPEEMEENEATAMLRFFQGTSTTAFGDPLIVLDGKVITQEQMDAIAPDEIQSISVLKGPPATDKYGSAARDGAIVISTKVASAPSRELEAGYGTVSALNSTAAISQLDMQDGQNYTDLRTYLQGRIAGVQFLGDVMIVRGINSINSKIEPLILVDGVEMGSFADVNAMLSPYDIDSVSVLKDGAATGIYGVKGANGVVIIKTKRGGNR